MAELEPTILDAAPAKSKTKHKNESLSGRALSISEAVPATELSSDAREALADETPTAIPSATGLDPKQQVLLNTAFGALKSLAENCDKLLDGVDATKLKDQQVKSTTTQFKGSITNLLLINLLLPPIMIYKLSSGNAT